MDLIIRGATVVTEAGSARLDVAVKSGQIAALLAPGASCPAREELDAKGLHLLPGLVDAHVHLREPGLTHKETLATGTVSAACGGVTTLLDMPNTVPPVADAAIFKAKTDLLKDKAHVDVGFYALLGPGMVGELRKLVDAGCVGFKLFLGPTTGNLQAPDWGELLAALRELARLDVPVVAHAEDRAMVEYWQTINRSLGDSYADFLLTRPAVGEVMATALICRLAAETGAKVHIAHVALAEAVEVIAAAKQAGWPVTAETCPPYLFLTSDDYEKVGTQMKVLPPIRHTVDNQALWDGLRSGVIDMVATDHAPHTAAEKNRPIWEAASGAPGVETLLPLLLTAANTGKCSVSDVVRWCAAAPAQRFNLTGKGCLVPGAWADMVLVDMKRRWTIQPHKLHTMASDTPFAGWQVTGAPVLTMLRGRVVAQDGEPMGDPVGRWVHPGGDSAA